MSELLFSPKSVEDLDEILQFISRDKPVAGIHFVEKLKEKCYMLPQFPEMGARREELAPGLRALAVSSYVIYYTIRPGILRIERVLHGARDRDAVFSDEV